MLQFASRISGMRFCEASAKDNFNVDEIFLKLVDDILSKVCVDVCVQLSTLSGVASSQHFFLFFVILQMPLEVPNKELSNSVLSLQPEPEVPPELPPPRLRCC